MTPAAWRKREGLTLRELAARLGCTRMSASRYESGEREAPNSSALTYERISGGEVTAEDLNRARGRYLHSKAA